MVTQKEKVEVLDAEVVEYIHNPDLEFKEPSRKKPRGKRKKDFPRFTDSVRASVLAATMKGAPLDTAADAAGVEIRTVQNWLERGQMAAELIESGSEEDIESIAPVEHDFASFYTQYKKAKSFGRLRLIEIISNACEDDPKLAMRWLEKLDPVEFGQKQQIHTTGELVHGHIHVSGSNRLPEGQDLTRRLPTQDLKALRSNIIKDKARLLESGEIEEDDE
jgi:hypothetical protein